MNTPNLPHAVREHKAGKVTSLEMSRLLKLEHRALKRKMLKHLGVQNPTEDPALDAGICVEPFTHSGGVHEQYVMSYRNAERIFTGMYPRYIAINALARLKTMELQADGA